MGTPVDTAYPAPARPASPEAAIQPPLPGLARRWVVAPPPDPRLFDLAPDLSPLVVRILANRGIRQPQHMRDFLAHRVADDDPYKLAGMNAAVARLRHAIERRERVAIYGDFDADGVTSTALLLLTLRALGGLAVPYIPHRSREGYGVHAEAVELLAAQGTGLLVTVDCGISAAREVAMANRLGLDVIVTDHHAMHDELPNAVAVINPRQPSCSYGYHDFAGVGLAYKLAQALLADFRASLPSRQAGGAVPDGLSEQDLLDLVALGTVADVAMLTGENRSLVQRGLRVLERTPRLGLQALIKVAGLGRGRLSAETIAYQLGPRLNASGRIGDAQTALELLLTQDPQRAEDLAAELQRRNAERQELEARTVEQSKQIVAAQPPTQIIIVDDPDFPPGVIGLAAQRLCEAYYRPAIVIERGPEVSRGSARSIDELNIVEALDEVDDQHGLFLRYGGHSRAAGFTILTSRLGELREHLTSVVTRRLDGLELAPTIYIDAEVPIEDVNWATLAMLEPLEPFGQGNPKPHLLCRGVHVRDARPAGTEHLKLVLGQPGRPVVDCVAFGQADWAANMPPRIDVVFTLGEDRFFGPRRLKLEAKDLRPSRD
jgi:single-stranded-DNA-specific exonuclease